MIMITKLWLMINLFLLLLHSCSPIFKALKEIMLQRSTLNFHMTILKYLLCLMLVVQMLNFK